MSGVSSGRSFLNIFSRAIIGHEAWQDYMLDYFDAAVTDFVGTMSTVSGIIGEPLPVVTFSGAIGHRVLTIDTGAYRFLLNGQIGYLDPDETLGCDDIPYDEAATQYMSLHLDEYPVAADVGTDGTVGYKYMCLGVGEKHTPSAVTVGATDIVLTVNTVPLWTDPVLTRPVIVWLATPVTGSTEAIYAGTLAVVAGALKVTVPHFLGQAIPSTTLADYCVFVAGPVVSAAVKPTTTHDLVCTVTPGTPDPTILHTYTTVKNLTSLKSIITTVAHALSGTSVDNIINRLTTSGEFTTDIKVATNPAGAFLNFLAREVYGAGLYRGYLQTGNIYSLFGLATGAPGSAVNRIDENGNITAHDLSVNGKVSAPAGAAVVFDNGVDVEGTTTLRGKVKNAAGADVVFDDGVTVEGKVTASGGLKTVTPTNVVATWNSGTSQFDATMNEVGGIVEVPFDASHPLPAAVGGVLQLNLSNSKIDTASRVQITLEYSGAGANKLPAATCEVNGAQVVATFYNHGSSAIENSVFVQFEVINPA
jgi:hypothetical protein